MSGGGLHKNSTCGSTGTGGSLFGLPTTTSTGVPLFTMEQIQQLQQQQQRRSNNHAVGAAENNSNDGSNNRDQQPPSQEVTTLMTGSSLSTMQQQSQPPNHQRIPSANTLLLSQYVLGQDVAPRVQETAETANFFGISSGTTPPNFDSFSDAALWKLFWDESHTTATVPSAAATLEETVTLKSNPGTHCTNQQQQQYSASRLYSNETVRAQNPNERMGSPSPTPSAMSCSTSESKPTKAAAVPRGQAHLQQTSSQQQQQSQRQQPPQWSNHNNTQPTTSSDQLALMLHQFQQQQDLMQQQLQPQHMTSATASAPLAYSSLGHQKQYHRPIPAAVEPPMSAQDINNASLLIPSIAMPPSVMTSVMAPCDDSDSYQAQVQQRRRKTAGGSGSNKRATKTFRQESPQHCLDRLLLQTRGFSPGQLRIKAEAAAYDTTPSPLQLASFGTELVRAIHTSDLDKLSQMLNCGLSPNPCNQFRDSIVDLVCKRANASVFQMLVEHGCDLRVCDGFGRTPLHHCGWASTFSPEIATLILQKDWRQLFLEDKRGQTPLEYVREDLFDDWINFLQGAIDHLVPQHIGALEPMKLQRPDGFVPDPANAIPPKLAMAVSAGRITPQQVHQMSPEMRARFDG